METVKNKLETKRQPSCEGKTKAKNICWKRMRKKVESEPWGVDRKNPQTEQKRK